MFYAEQLAELRGQALSGVYAFFDKTTRECLYIGESHTGRLYDTLTRHFRAWKINPNQDRQGRRYGGTNYNRARILVDVLICAPSQAQDLQYLEIQRLQPRDNAIDGASIIIEDEIPT